MFFPLLVRRGSSLLPRGLEQAAAKPGSLLLCRSTSDSPFDRQAEPQRRCLQRGDYSQAGPWPVQREVYSFPCSLQSSPTSSSTFGAGVEERICPWMPSQLHLEHYESLLFTRDKLQRFTFCASPPASTPFHWGSRNAWEDKSRSERCEKTKPADIQALWFLPAQILNCRAKAQGFTVSPATAELMFPGVGMWWA